jgi:hypothetical protein
LCSFAAEGQSREALRCSTYIIQLPLDRCAGSVLFLESLPLPVLLLPLQICLRNMMNPALISVSVAYHISTLRPAHHHHSLSPALVLPNPLLLCPQISFGEGGMVTPGQMLSINDIANEPKVEITDFKDNAVYAFIMVRTPA